LVFSVDLTKSYAREPLTNDDLPRILADAKTNQCIDRFVQMGFREGQDFTVSLYDKWAIDRKNDSYLFDSRGLSDTKVYRRGYMFFYRGKAFGVYVYMSNYVEKNSPVPKGMVGWVSLTRDFSAPPPQDPDFQRAFSEAYDVFLGRRWPKPIFSTKQHDKESSK
jgi:hypothetical protein